MSEVLDSSGWQVPNFETLALRKAYGRYALGIPVINEGDRLHRELRRIQSHRIGELIDVVVADGGSSDGSVDPRQLSQMGVHTLLTKAGPGALSAQLRMFFAHALISGYEGVVIIDGNDKDGVESIPDFTSALTEGWDYVQGSRYMPGGCEQHTPIMRKLGVKYLHAPLLSFSAGVHYTDTTNGFRAISRRLLLDPRVQPFRDVFDSYNLHFYLSRQAGRLSFRVKEIPVSRRYPANGTVPTKIRGLKGAVEILKLLFVTVLGGYDPPDFPRSED